MFISIIIPAYNVEPYIDRCLRSVLCQDVSLCDYEVIIINDGSTDETTNILNRWKLLFPNLRVFCQNNLGQSAARNWGIREAEGDYIMFVDSDDWLLDDCLSELIVNLKHNRPDILRYSFDFGHVEIYTGEYGQIFTGKEILRYCKLIWSPCLQLIRKDFIVKNEFFFKEGITSEDAELLPRLYWHAEKVMVLDKSVYHYFNNPNSTTKCRKIEQKKITDRINSQFEVLKSVFHLMEESEMNEETIQSLMESVVFPSFTYFCNTNIQKNLSYKSAKEFQRLYLKEEFYPILPDTNFSLKHSLLYQIMNHSIFFDLFWLIRRFFFVK
jgi:glycosyltransferase involved in cell wall biosynthesis